MSRIIEEILGNSGKNDKKFSADGQKWRGFRGGNFLPASRFFCFVFASPRFCGAGNCFSHEFLIK